MTLNRFLSFVAAVLGAATLLQAQQPNIELDQKAQPTFKEHRLGESAQEFFSIAKMADKESMLSADYCRSFLVTPKVKKAIEKAKTKDKDNQPSSALWTDVKGCSTVLAALAGQTIEVDSRFAAEFDSGSMQFIAGHLASVRFTVQAPFVGVVQDMNAKLNARPQLDIVTLQNAIAAIQKQHRAIWTLPSIFAKVSEVQSLAGDDIGTEVFVSSPALLESRRNSLN
ncbi:MAG: hypothetical protein CXZ00_00115 [Acidobacteria bacterium]|nr:MAG: hypothetical protein CXZ00_00115 [Acidobacteriota bacterium]